MLIAATIVHGVLALLDFAVDELHVAVAHFQRVLSIGDLLGFCSNVLLLLCIFHCQ